MMEKDARLQAQATDHPEIAEWLRQHRESFYAALGVGGGFDDEAMILALVKLVDSLEGRWRGYKDEIDRARCDVIVDYLHSTRKVSAKELRIAIALLVQHFNRACEEIWVMKMRQHSPKPSPPYYRYPYPLPRSRFRG